MSTADHPPHGIDWANMPLTGDSMISTTVAKDWKLPVRSIDEVVGRMRVIAAALPERNGIAHFNRLYLKVTEEVGRAVETSVFEDPAFLSTLDLLFASRYFDALSNYLTGAPTPRAWRALFDARQRPGVSALRFAVAGMNAHINFDLALALVDTARARHLALETGLPQHRDYERVNLLLERTMPAAKAWFATGLIGVADTALGSTDDEVAMWSIVRAREAAWVHAEALQAVAGTRLLAARLEDTLDRSVGLAGRALLTPQTPLAT